MGSHSFLSKPHPSTVFVLNAGAALYAADVASSLKQGVEMAHDALHSGLARDKFEELVSFTAVFRQENAQ